MKRILKMAKNRKRKPKTKEDEQKKEQRAFRKEIKDFLNTVGFSSIQGVNGTEFIYEDRKSEMDAIFIYENIVLIVEDTISASSDHLLLKKILFDKINYAPSNFMNCLLNYPQKFSALKEYWKKNIHEKYSMNQIQLKILYCSKNLITEDHKRLVDNINYLDYPVLLYFKKLSQVIKRSTQHEFFDFLHIKDEYIGENVVHSSTSQTNVFRGNILPEQYSSFPDGYKVISFYIDAESLLKRAQVLRKGGWRDSNGDDLYQRMLNPKKIKDMRKFLNDNDRVFINNIIVTIPVKEIKLYRGEKEPLSINELGNIEPNQTFKTDPISIEINDKTNIIGIIDGQHRVYTYHEGNDVYEPKISKLRKRQNLLVTALLFPPKLSQGDCLKFEAKIFKEINSNQKRVSTELLQAIETIQKPFSVVAIARKVLQKLNNSGPLLETFELSAFDKDKIKVSTIINYGLMKIVKFDIEEGLFSLWDNPEKDILKEANKKQEKLDEFSEREKELLQEYILFCFHKIKDLFIAFKDNVGKERWLYRKKNTNRILNVIFINGVIHCLIQLIKNKKTGSIEDYRTKLTNIGEFDFDKYKGSHYAEMGQDLYQQFFNQSTT